MVVAAIGTAIYIVISIIIIIIIFNLKNSNYQLLKNFNYSVSRFNSFYKGLYSSTAVIVNSIIIIITIIIIIIVVVAAATKINSTIKF